MRINKFLASCALGSRRKVEQLIITGKVRINDAVCTDLATIVDPKVDQIRVGHHIVKPVEKKTIILMNKPRGYVVTRNDEFNRKTVYDLLPDFAKELHTVGRLDYDSEGLLLLTNDGDLTNKITHPSGKIEKIYKVVVKGKINMESVKKLRSGEGSEFQSAKVFLKNSSEEKSELRMGICEGKNRQIRKMMELVGHEVITLKRLQIGEIKLEKLPVGMWRFLSDREILSLLKN